MLADMYSFHDSLNLLYKVIKILKYLSYMLIKVIVLLVMIRDNVTNKLLHDSAANHYINLTID
jgi:hypothetical protein